MKIDRIEWLREARQSIGYRRMYGLVVMIVSSSTSTEMERKAAEYIKKLLDAVIGLALACSATLTKARIGFAHLTNIVVAAACDRDIARDR